MSVPLYGQVPVSGVAQPLTAQKGAKTMWVLKAPITNGNPVFIGDSQVTTGTGYQLDPGEIFEYEYKSPNLGASYELAPSDIYVVGTPGDKVTWFASP